MILEGICEASDAFLEAKVFFALPSCLVVNPMLFLVVDMKDKISANDYKKVTVSFINI